MLNMLNINYFNLSMLILRNTQIIINVISMLTVDEVGFDLIFFFFTSAISDVCAAVCVHRNDGATAPL